MCSGFLHGSNNRIMLINIHPYLRLKLNILLSVGVYKGEGYSDNICNVLYIYIHLITKRIILSIATTSMSFVYNVVPNEFIYVIG